MENYNSTLMSDAGAYHRLPVFNALGSLATILIALISISGNSAVVIASFWDEALRVQTGNILIVYLSVTDILTATLVMLPSSLAVALDYWPLGWFACKANAFFNYMFACSSSFNIALISVDRAIAVTYPLQYQNIVTWKVMGAFMAWLFILGSVIGGMCTTLGGCIYDYTEGVCALDYTTKDTEAEAIWYILTVGCTACFFVPVSIVGVCNAMIIATANKSGKKNTQQVFVRRTGQSESQMKKTIKSMIVVVLTYYILFSPYALPKLTKVISGVDMPPWLNYYATLSIFVESATNPFIYAILRKDYRDAFKKLPKMMIDKCFC